MRFPHSRRDEQRSVPQVGSVSERLAAIKKHVAVFVYINGIEIGLLINSCILSPRDPCFTTRYELGS